MTVYAGTSSLVKLFITESGSEDVPERLSTANSVFSSEVAYPEVRAALDDVEFSSFDDRLNAAALKLARRVR